MDAISFCRSNPPVILDVFLFAIAGSLGQCFIFMTLESFGSLVLVTVTVTRKLFSILLSVVWFGHHLSLGQWCSVGLVFVAIVWESSGKAAPPKLKKKEQ
jgi:UDP-galactose transporter B1